MATSPTALPAEVEWQFDALDLRPVERFIARVQALAGPGRPGLELSVRPTKRLVDRYLDSADWRIGRAGRVLRVRRDGRNWIATLKDLAETEDGLRTRIEIEERLAASVLPVDGDGAVTSRVRALAGSAKLVDVLEVRTRRRPYELSREGAPLGELVLDETTITAAGLRRPLRLRRVELELLGAAKAELEPFVVALREECALQPAALSKFEAGLLAAGIAIPKPVELTPLAVGPESTLGQLAFAALRADANEVVRREPGTRLGEDPEELHKMRVATRRLRAALKLFAEALPVRSAHFEEELGWLASELGSVRDLDVQLEQLAEWREETAPDDEEGLAELAATLEEARLGTREALLRSLDSRRYTRLIAGLSQMLSAAPPRRSLRARTPCSIGLPELIDARQRAARKAARRARRSGVAEDFHRLRIRTKRLRYALEFSARSYGTMPRRYTRSLASLQDELGLMQDAVVAAERLRAAALSGTGALSLGAVFAIGGLAERYRHEAERLLGQLGGRSRVVSGSQWKRLEAEMERRRTEALTALQAARPTPRRTPVARLALVPVPEAVPPESVPPHVPREGLPLPR